MTPPLVRKYAEDYPPLKAAIAAVKRQVSIEEALGYPPMFPKGPSPTDDADHIKEIAEASQHLLEVVTEVYEHFATFAR